MCWSGGMALGTQLLPLSTARCPSSLNALPQCSLFSPCVAVAVRRLGHAAAAAALGRLLPSTSGRQPHLAIGWRRHSRSRQLQQQRPGCGGRLAAAAAGRHGASQWGDAGGCERGRRTEAAEPGRPRGDWLGRWGRAWGYLACVAWWLLKERAGQSSGEKVDA